MVFQNKSLLNEWVNRSGSAQWVLGVVYKTQGPCYRKPGAIMFINSDGEYFGLLSGGCLEADIQLQARKVMQSGRATTLCYDGADEDDISFQLGIGCGGIVYIALLPITVENNHLHLKDIHRTLEERASGVLSIKIPNATGTVACEFHRNMDKTAFAGSAELLIKDGAEWLQVVIEREPHLLLIGGGVDAKPMVALAHQLGWEVTLWDSRPANARREYFLSANSILECSVEELGQYAIDQHVNAVVLMTHNLELDAEALKALCQVRFNYLGLLGPHSRREKVLELAELGDEQIQTPLAGPAGFDLGGELPESIALSIVSECHAHFYGFTGGPVNRKI